MYYPIGWPKKLNFQYKDISVVTGHDGRSDDQPSDRLPHSGGSNGHDPPQSNQVNGHANETNGQESGSETGQQSSNDKRLLQIAANSDRTLFAVLTPRSLHVWFSRPSVEIVCHWRSNKSIDQLGHNFAVHWKPDSTAIVIKTTRDVLIFYQVAFKDDFEAVFEQTDSVIAGLRRESVELIVPDRVPSLYLLMSFSTEVAPGISSILAAEEDVVVATKSGEIIGINWDGTLDPNFRWEVSDGTDGFIVRDIKYSSMIGGFSLVFMNGKVAFMPIHYNPEENGPSSGGSSKHQPQSPTSNGPQNPGKIAQRRVSLPNVSSRVLFVADVDNGVTSSINHKYQIIAFGLKNNEGIICCIDEEHSLVVVTHKIILPANTFPETSVHSIGCMSCMQWSPDSMVLATSWEKGGFALWSVFGALLMCSLSWDFGHVDRFSPNVFVASSLAWSREGYQLWLIADELKEDSTGALMQMSMAKSMLASNPSAICCCRESLLLMTEDRLYLGVGTSSSETPSSTLGDRKVSMSNSSESSRSKDEAAEELLPSTNYSSKMECRQQPVEVGNQQWIVIQIPFSYLSTNWPVRLASVDKSGQSIAIAGRSGFAHYSMLTRKWKLFGNESQEKDFEVCGGIVYYEQFVILSCYNIPESCFEIRAYPVTGRLDNTSMKICKVSSEILVMSIHGNQLLTLESDGTINLLAFTAPPATRRQSVTSKSSLNPDSFTLIHVCQINISNLVIPPECVVSIFLTSLHLESSATDSDSILVNVCGRVFLLERRGAADTGEDDDDELPIVSYKAVSILASGVENIWVSPKDSKELNSDRPHLTDSLWLSRGCNGMNVWLPLLPSPSEKVNPQSSAHNFMSKRIMLPINTHIYPLAVLFRDAVVIGAENDTLHWGKSCPIDLPYSTISRTSQVYLHHILRELLKRNLGIHAWDIANTCTTLPHFPHSLELLLHETLEEEATSSQPIPDALLPRVVEFIRSFPVFLETIVHCARKTELALWPHLFSVVGNPKDLFQSCLDKQLLETAASYLLILQNLERTSVSRKYATLLLDSAKKSARKELANDLSRFLDSIDPLDFECPPSKAALPAMPPGASNVHSVKYHSPPVRLDGQVSQRLRTLSGGFGTLANPGTLYHRSVSESRSQPDHIK